MTTLWDSIRRSLSDSAKFARDGAQVAAEKAEVLGKKSKIHLDISNIKRRIEKLFTELGGKVYHLMEEENVSDLSGHAEVEELVKKIKEQEKQLNAKHEELENIGKKPIEEVEVPETPPGATDVHREPPEPTDTGIDDKEKPE